MRRAVLVVAGLIATVTVVFEPVLGFAFLNWDDTLVVVDNPALVQPGMVRWALTTLHVEHYQPVSWLIWAGLRGADGPDPRVYHAANLAMHAIAVLLVWAVTRRLCAGRSIRHVPSSPARGGQVRQPMRGRVPRAASGGAEAAAIAAALLYGLHPLRIEVVAWVSAMPYALATALAFGATLAWLNAGAAERVSWPALGLFTLSLAARPVALGLPLALATLDWWLFERQVAAIVRRALPYAGVSLAFGLVEWAARAPGAAEVPVLFRLQSAALAPLAYLRQIAAPVGLTPLDVLPLDPQGQPGRVAAAVAALGVLSAAAWGVRRRWPSVPAAWFAYLALLAPAVGFLPSGLQATADRYTYLPGIVPVLALAGWTAHVAGQRPMWARAAAGLAVAALAASILTTRALLPHWRDSVALWTRVVALDPGSDVGHYNLGAALAAAGRPDEAAEHYRTALAVNPAHAEARANLDRLDAAHLEREANDLASRGRLAEAAERYQAALDRDPRRAHSHAARGMALAALGRAAEAVPHLREAITLGAGDPAVASTLAGLLVESGRSGEARAVLEGALTVHPADVGLAHNLARTLVSLPGRLPQDTRRALDLAEAVVQRTGGRDPRALDTLSLALAANGRLGEAQRISEQAVKTAEELGEMDLARHIRGRRFGR